MKRMLLAVLLAVLLLTASGCGRVAREEPVHLIWWMMTGS